jgi:hypothetical protein
MFLKMSYIINKIKSKPKLVSDTYTYQLKKISKNKFLWQCVLRKDHKCKGLVETMLINNNHQVINSIEHKCVNQIGKGIRANSISNESSLKIMAFPIDKKHLCFKHPFTCMLAGPTSSGKTVLFRQILENFEKTFYFKTLMPEKLKILWAYGQWQSLYEQKIDKTDIIYVEGLPTEEEVSDYKPHIIVIDDLMTELGNDKKLTNLFTKGSHHLDISVVFISQNIFHQGSQMRTISLNCHYMILMKNPRDKAQINALASQIYPNKSKFLIEAYNDATKIQFGYIRVDMKQDTPDNYRVQTRIIPEANSKYSISPISYVPK